MDVADESSIRGRTSSGVAWTTAQKWLVRLTGFATVAILARLLGPADFGLVAAASTVIPVLYLLSDLGFATYVIQAETLTQRMLDTAFWFATVAGVVLSGLLVAVAPLVAGLLGIDGLESVLMVLSAAVLLVALGSVPTALLRRRMEFRALAIQSGVASVLGQIVAVVAAVAGAGVWALVAQLVLYQAVLCALAWRAARWRPRVEFDTGEFRGMSRFGLSVVGVELVALARAWAETAIVTLGLGVTGLGYLNIAQRLVDASKDLTVSAVMPVATAAFAKIRTSTERLRRGYLDLVEVTYAIAVPFVAILVVGGPFAVPIAFGGGWGTSVAPTQALAVASLMVVGAMVDHALFYGSGRPASWLGYAFLTDGLTVATTAVCVRFGLSGVAAGFVGVALLALLIRSVLVARLLGVSTGAVLVPFLRAVGMLACCSALGALAWLVPGDDLLRLTLVVALVGVCFLALLRPLLPRASRTIDPLAARARRLLASRLPGRTHTHAQQLGGQEQHVDA